MNAAELKDLLKNRYGINNEEEFNAAVEKSEGINIGIFNMPIPLGNIENECTPEAKISA